MKSTHVMPHLSPRPKFLIIKSIAVKWNHVCREFGLEFGLNTYRSHTALTGSRLPCVAHPDASAEQPLDGKPVDQKQDVLFPSPDDPRMLESCENHERAPNPGQTASGPLRTVTHRGNRLGWPTQPGLGGGGAALSVLLWQHARILHKDTTNILCDLITQQMDNFRQKLPL